jgi:hypothetical protein
MRIEDVFMMGEKTIEVPWNPEHKALNRTGIF